MDSATHAAEQSQNLAETSPPFRLSFRAHQFQLAEFGGTLVWWTDQQKNSPVPFTAWQSLKQPLTNFLRSGMKIPNLSSGLRLWTPFHH